MLIECDYCGAPLDVKPNRSTAKCAYCGKTSQIEQARQVAQQTPNGWRPPPTWTPPQHVPAPSDQALKYRRVVGRVIVLAVALPMLFTVGIGAVIAVVAGAQTSAATSALGEVTKQVSARIETTQATETGRLDEVQTEALDQALTAVRQATQQIASGAGAQAAGGSLFESNHAEALAVKFAARLGAPVRALELTLYPTYAFLQAQDPENASHVDKYPYRNGTITAPEPVRLHLRGKLEDHLFSLGDVALDKVPALIRQTVKALDYEADAKPSHIIVERNLPFSKDVVIRVYVKSARDSGRVDYKADGTVLRVFK